MFGVSGWSAMEWLTMTGWTVELGGGVGTLYGTATREVYGDTLQITGEGATQDGVAWALVDRAETELERWEDSQRMVVAV